ADANEDLVDLAHAAGDVERDRKEAGDRPHGHLRSRPDAEPHDHDGEEDDLRAGTEVIEIGLVGARHEFAAAEQNADGEPAQTADYHRNGDLVGSRAEVEIKSR